MATVVVPAALTVALAGSAAVVVRVTTAGTRGETLCCVVAAAVIVSFTQGVTLAVETVVGRLTTSSLA